jgi:Cytochrome P450
MFRYEKSVWHRLERWRTAGLGESGVFRTATGLWMVTEPELVTQVFERDHDAFRAPVPFFNLRGRGPLPAGLRSRALARMLEALAEHRFPDDRALLSRCLAGAPAARSMQGWGSRFLRQAYADVILAVDRPESMQAAIDDFVDTNIVRRGIRGERFISPVRTFRRLTGRLAVDLARLDSTGTGRRYYAADLVDVVQTLRGALSVEERAEILLRLVIALVFATGVALEWAVALAASSPDPAPSVPDERRARAAVLEAQRLYPTAWGPVRTTLRPVDLGGHRVPRGEDVIVVNYLIHRSGRHWVRPDEYRPERMLGHPSVARGSFQPFLFGPTACPGRPFALKTLARSVGALLRGCDLRVAPEEGAVPQVRFLLAPPRGTIHIGCVADGRVPPAPGSGRGLVFADCPTPRPGAE